MLTSLSVDEILLSMYVKWSTNFRDLSFNMKHKLCFHLSLHRDQCLRMAVPGYAGDIRLGQVYLREMFCNEQMNKQLFKRKTTLHKSISTQTLASKAL